MELTGTTFFFDWEVQLMTWLQSHLGSAGAAVASFFSMFGEELICVAVLGFLYWCYDKSFGRRVGLNVLVAITLNPMAKNIVQRRRPYFDHEAIQCLKPVDGSADIYDIAAQGLSFPSGHSTNSVTVFTSIALLAGKKWLTVLGVLLPLLCGVSRFCLGVHYPTDVLCGWLLGLAVVLLLPLVEKKIPHRGLFCAVILALTLPGFFFCRSADYFSSFGMLAGFLAGTEFERKYVRFENTRNPLRCVLRVLIGGLLFFGLSAALKLPFSKDFLASATLPAFAVRAARYAVALFISIGLYPMLFRWADRFFPKDKAANESAAA